MRNIVRVLKFSFQSFWRNLWLSVVTLTIFCLTLLTVNAVLAVGVLADGALRAVEEEIQVVVYFTPGASQEIQQSVRGYLLGLPQVRTIDSITADEALANFRERNANNPTVLSALDEVDGNPIGDAILISAQSPDDFDFIIEAVQRPEYTEYIKKTDYTDYQDAIALLDTITTRLRWAGFALTGFFGLVSILIIFNAIRVAIYVHRDEIAIMKLVGAHDWFVRAPFLLEGVFLSLLAAGLVAAVVLGMAKTLDVPLVQYVGNTDVSLWEYFSVNGWTIFGAEFAALAVLSMLTTAFTMRKHLRV